MTGRRGREHLDRQLLALARRDPDSGRVKTGMMWIRPRRLAVDADRTRLARSDQMSPAPRTGTIRVLANGRGLASHHFGAAQFRSVGKAGQSVGTNVELRRLVHNQPAHEHACAWP